MAVQKNRVSRAKRGARRSHDQLVGRALSVDRTSGEVHLRHHLTADGYYRGQKIVSARSKKAAVDHGETATG